MDKSFYNNYFKYFLWNNGLLDHFFAKGKHEIMLHVDKLLLEEIGKTIGIDSEDYAKEFESCVKGFCRWYIKYASATIMCPTINKCIRCSTNSKKWSCSNCNNCKYKPCIRNREDILAVANHILTRPIEYFDKYVDENGRLRINMSDDKKLLKHRLPYFAIVIYLIYKFDNNKTQQWENVGTDIAAKSREFIPQIFQKIHEFDERFDDTASVYDRSESDRNDYAGRILYHLPLSASTRNKIQDAIYKSSAWKLIDSKTFLEIVGLIMNSLKDVKANEELRNILLKCYSVNDYKGISARKVQAVIDDFDIDAYESKIAERKQLADYSQTIVSGEFALGIYFPNDDDGIENSIVLLTTVQQSVNEKGFDIKEGDSDTWAGYNTTFVRFENNSNIELRDYALKTNKYNIVPIPTGDVVFFYEYYGNLFIQTQVIKPAKSYYIAVRVGKEDEFELWCERNKNIITEKISKETSSDLFGNNWTIYYSENRLNGQYYPRKVESIEAQDISKVIMKGGIRKNYDTYFINALPYFEVPTIYDLDDIKIYVNLNNVLFENYTKHIVDNKIILDVPQMPIDSDEIAYMDIGVECGKETIATYNINVCGQSIDYNKEFLYKYNRFGIKVDAEYSYSANDIDEHYMSNRVWGLFSLTKDNFTEISEEFYFTNLLAACCFANEFSEITHDRLRKCISYAATRLNIDIQREGFIKNAKNALNKAGLVQIDNTSNKCQAIPPSFMKVPYSDCHSDGTQLIMLSGCYTRAFLADLRDYCEQENVKIYLIKNKSDKDEEKLIPPVILLGHNFNPNDFCDQYGHTCNVVLGHDFALSLLNVMPSFDAIKSRFEFVHNDSDIFLSSLEASKSVCMPRLRSMRTVANLKQWYIEKSNNYFAVIPQGHMAWASIYCLHEQGSSMIVYNENEKSAYISNSLILPNYVQRALYLMNLGLPEQKKVFMCDNPDSNYFSIMSYYHLNSNERREVLVSKLTGNEVGTARKCVDSKGIEMEFWRLRINVRKQSERYLILYSDNVVLAIATDGKVYLNCLGVYHRINSEHSMNKILSFLIKEKWNYLYDRTAIGYSRNGGNEITKVYGISSTELIVLPEKAKFNIDKIEIV